MNEQELDQASFEMLLAELKKTLDILEKGDLALENSMKAYEYGLALVRRAEQKLGSMEGRMEQLLTDGTLKALDPSELVAEA